MRLNHAKYADGSLINGVSVTDNDWYLISIAFCGLGRYFGIVEGTGKYDTDEDDKVKVIGVDVI